MIPVGADLGGHCDSSWGWGRSLSPPRAGRQMDQMQFCRAQSKNHPSSAPCWAENHKLLEGEADVDRKGWMLKAREVMPKLLITWAYHVQWLLLAHEIEPFSLLSAFPPQLGPQVAFSSVWKEESYCHLSKEFIKTQNMWPFKHCNWVKLWSLVDMLLCPLKDMICNTSAWTWWDHCNIYSRTKGYSYIAMDLQCSKAVFSRKGIVKAMEFTIL